MNSQSVCDHLHVKVDQLCCVAIGQYCRIPVFYTLVFHRNEWELNAEFKNIIKKKPNNPHPPPQKKKRGGGGGEKKKKAL